MFAVLPLAAWALGFAALRPVGAGDPNRGWRWSFLTACVAWGMVLAAGTEVLGALRLFGRGPVALLWILAALGAAGSLWRRRGRVVPAPPASPAGAATVPGPLVFGLGVILGTIFVTALLAAPNSWDSLTYHLPRILHWIQNRDVAHYPTQVLRQLFMPPGAEYTIGHLLLLTGVDRLANLPQWFALAGSAVGISRIAAQLGGSAIAQGLAAVFAVTLPMSVAQGSSSQNDAVVAFWLIAFVSFLLPVVSRPETPRAADVLLGGSSLGLAFLTKGTAPLYALPFAVLFLVFLIRRAPKTFWGPLLLAAALVLAPNAPHLLRNQSLFGSPIGPPAGVLAEGIGPRAFASNVLRNAALHLALPSPEWNRGVESAVRTLHDTIGADPEDPRTTWRGSAFHVPPVPPGSAAAEESDETLFLLLHEGYAASPLHLLLAVAGLVAAARAGRPTLLYAIACAAAWLLFCAALKWQPWHARLHMPLFLLSAPAVGLALSMRRRLAGWVAGLLFAASLPWLLLNSTRPLLGIGSVLTTPRLEQSFVSRPDLIAPYRTAARELPPEPCPVGLRIGPDDPEYLVALSLKAEGHPERPLVHVDVQNASRAAARPDEPVPCATWDSTGGGETPRVMPR